MDWKGKQKIILICMILGVTAIFATIFFCKAIYVNNIFKNQEKELTGIYPELADELSENISYYAAKIIQTEFPIMLIIMLLTVMALACTCCRRLECRICSFRKCCNWKAYFIPQEHCL